jgi:hypothetical protein
MWGAGFWYPYQNIFSLVDELGLQPFTTWTRSAQYSPNGLEVKWQHLELPEDFLSVLSGPAPQHIVGSNTAIVQSFSKHLHK